MGPVVPFGHPVIISPVPESALGTDELGLWNKAPLLWGKPSGSPRNCLPLSRLEGKSIAILQPGEDGIFECHAERLEECSGGYPIISPSKSSVGPLQYLDLVLSHDSGRQQS